MRKVLSFGFIQINLVNRSLIRTIATRKVLSFGFIQINLVNRSLIRTFAVKQTLSEMGVYKNVRLQPTAQDMRIHSIEDERGILCFVDNSELPFNVERVFWISHVPEGQTRGGHAHKVCAEILFPAAGEFDVYVDDGTSSVVCHLSNPNEGLYIGPDVWCRVENFSKDAVCVVLASHRYMREGYLNTYEEFKEYMKNRF